MCGQLSPPKLAHGGNIEIVKNHQLLPEQGSGMSPFGYVLR